MLISNGLRLIFFCLLFLAQPISFHCSRHTFSTTVTLSQGVPLETVSKMLGHKHITTTQIYAKITNDKIGHDMDALSQKIAEKFPIA